ncbi:hypothetical protein [Pantoea sp. Aalb]|uniref:hypothetical protein n=1 Tax=Pantoea sp. Aalb TaxID=2576762 RepID=UPI0013274789|nr:hypothetical protein [Pantoea sp. Aalb]MXP68010.1 hypothetical protein [Pantoea sp. Aalb]
MVLMVDTQGSIHEKHGEYNIFRQLSVKIFADHINDIEYYKWLNEIQIEIKYKFPTIEFKERNGVRITPPLNTAVYYDNDNYQIIPTGSLLRTSSNKLTHAFCAFKMPEDLTGNRIDRRHVFKDKEKKIIQEDSISPEAIHIVKKLITRSDVDQPGTFLEVTTGISPHHLNPSMILRGYRTTFYVLIDGYDILRCSIDRSAVFDLRSNKNIDNYINWKKFREIELSLYPRISEHIKSDLRIIQIIEDLRDSLISYFNTYVIYDIKYQRGMKMLNKY